MLTSGSLLRAYDEQLRAEAEVADAPELTRIGPLLCATFPRRERGFITYADPVVEVEALIVAALDHYQADSRVNQVEWKSRSHDDIPNLAELLARHGFVAEDAETVMAGPIADVIDASDGLPPGYRLEQALDDAQIREAESLAAQVFGSSEQESVQFADELIRRHYEYPDSFEMWLVRDSSGNVVCSGRVDFVDGTDFAGVWGGACAARHRGKGLYRAITAARATSAHARGKKYLQSDCTEFSRPILQRAGLQPITVTIPYLWRR